MVVVVVGGQAGQDEVVDIADRSAHFPRDVDDHLKRSYICGTRVGGKYSGYKCILISY